MKARYVEELVDIVGDAKYGIFCFTKGPRSAATEIANGDFDGDISSRFSELLSGRKGAYLLLNPTLSGIQKWVSFYGLGDHEVAFWLGYVQCPFFMMILESGPSQFLVY